MGDVGHWIPQPLPYNPLHDDAQAMALVKKFELGLGRGKDRSWIAHTTREAGTFCHSSNNDLNRAICECVAKMRK
jgi:hypothetical protein